MKERGAGNREYLLATEKPSKSILTLALPATLGLLVKAIYNITDTAFIGMLRSETALAAVGVTIPLLLLLAAVEGILATGGSVIAGRYLGAGNRDKANETVSTIFAMSVGMGVLICVLGQWFMEPILRTFGASDTVLPLAKEYGVWMFVGVIASIPSQSLNAAARAESSAKISAVAIITGAVLNIVLDPIFMFDWGLGLGVAGASIATTISQFATAAILLWHYGTGRMMIKLSLRKVKISYGFIKSVVCTGIPTAVVQITMALSASFVNIVAASLENSDYIIAACGIVQRLLMVGCYLVIGLMQGYQPIASYTFGAKDTQRFDASRKFALKATLILSACVGVAYVLLSKPLIQLFNSNLLVVDYGYKMLTSQVVLFPAFGLVYFMTIVFQAIGESKYGAFLSTIRQGVFFIPLILLLPRFFGMAGFYFAQPIADVLTLTICIASYPRIRGGSEVAAGHELGHHHFHHHRLHTTGKQHGV